MSEIRAEPCTKCGGDVKVVRRESRRQRVGRTAAPPPEVMEFHADGGNLGDKVDDGCTRGQHGPTADHGEG